VPVGRVLVLDGRDVARGAPLFPVVGAGVGALAGGVAALLYRFLPALPAAGVGVAAAVLVTGALHVDALADTFDASGAHTREQALEIMRDSRIGSFGATAVVLDLTIKVGAVAALLTSGSVLTAFVAAGALSRAAAPPLAALLAYPRVGGGPGSVLSGGVSRLAAGLTIVVGIGLAVLVNRVDGAVEAGAVLIAVICLGLVYRSWLGGATGDCLGAATEIGETIVLVVAAGLA
jgi:adenosylcobinamide-GDP ribazoletransferase